LLFSLIFAAYFFISLIHYADALFAAYYAITPMPPLPPYATAAARFADFAAADAAATPCFFSAIIFHITLPTRRHTLLYAFYAEMLMRRATPYVPPISFTFD